MASGDGGFRFKFMDASGYVTADGKSGDVAGWVLSGTAVGATVVFKDGGSAGTTRFTINATSAGTAILSPSRANFTGLFPNDVYVTITNAGLLIWYEQYE